MQLFAQCPIAPTPSSAPPARAWMHDMIWGQQQPVYATWDNPDIIASWRDVGVGSLLEIMGPKKFLRLMVSPTGVFGFYDGDVPVDMDAHRVFIRPTSDAHGAAAAVEVPHIRFEAEAEAMMTQWARKGPGDYFITPDEHCYFRSIGGVMDIPRIAGSIPGSIPTDKRTMREVNFYLSQPGTLTNLHYDPVGGAVCQLKGRKRVLLFPPSEAARFEMHPEGRILARRSRHAGRLTPAYLAAHPALSAASGIEYILQPGEWLFQPKGWLHYIETLDVDTISLIVTFRA